MSNDFDAWADVYDSVYSYVHEDIPFYVDRARTSGSPVLELGCGTGRVTLPIAEAGIDIVGVDISETMLGVARHKVKQLPKASGAVSLKTGDMRKLSIGHRFKLIIIPFRGFLSLLTIEDQIKTLMTIREHLEPGAELAMNIFVPDPNMLVQDADVPYHFRDVTVPTTKEHYILWQQNSYDNHNQVLYSRLIAEQLDLKGDVVRRFYRDFQLRYVHRWEMYHLLKSCGFEDISLCGDFDESPFDEGSAEMVWMARAP